MERKREKERETYVRTYTQTNTHTQTHTLIYIGSSRMKFVKKRKVELNVSTINFILDDPIYNIIYNKRDTFCTIYNRLNERKRI